MSMHNISKALRLVAEKKQSCTASHPFVHHVLHTLAPNYRYQLAAHSPDRQLVL
jgi:hypothetical protein